MGGFHNYEVFEANLKCKRLRQVKFEREKKIIEEIYSKKCGKYRCVSKGLKCKHKSSYISFQMCKVIFFLALFKNGGLNYPKCCSLYYCKY